MQRVDLILVKGKLRPVEIYTVLGGRESGLQEAVVRAWEDYERGVDLYRQRSFEEARILFERSGKEARFPELSRLYAERCRVLLEKAPGPEWDGVFVMESK
ncbi:MAG: hypothetical protein HC904_11685 [Blastochloris sp.]|nr:hypothetical protein [Blastochloris sp.]